MLFLAANLSFVLRYYVDWRGLFAPGPSPWAELYRAIPLMIAVWSGVFVSVGLYSDTLNKKREFFLLLKASVMAFCLIFAAAFFYRGFSYSRVAAAFMVLLVFILDFGFRLAFRAASMLARHDSGQGVTGTGPQEAESRKVEQRKVEPREVEPREVEPREVEPVVTGAKERDLAISEPVIERPVESKAMVQNPSSDDAVIRVENASVRYTVYKSRRRNLREALFRSMLRRDEKVEVWALRDISFEVPRGEALGVIGANGAGKSTLCLLLSQIMEPTTGKVTVGGNVSALLSLGAGFQMDLTGRDNIFLNGVYLGFSLDEMREKFRDILEFSGIRDYIDMPVRTYSSGMRARLAFSISAIVEPEIMIIDELMGVGDMKFRQKSTEKMRELITRSKALVVVSHTMATIRSLCTRAVWLDKGRLMAQGPVEEVISQYEES